MLPLALLALAADPVDYEKDVRPVLAAACVQCHGENPKTRKANLRFDTPTWATDVTLVVPGKSDKSDVIARLVSKNPRQVMPPPKFERQLTPAEIATLRRWVDEGAKTGTR